MKRALASSSALFWGLQFAFLNPVLALLLVSLYDATPGQVGWVLAIYNAVGFVASLVVPAYADRRGDYLRPMLMCGALTFVLAVVLWMTSSLPIAVVALVVVGAPAGVGVSLLFAHLKFAGARMSEVIHTRAVVSVAWVAGPALATVIMSGLGNRSILPVLAVVAVFNMATTLLMMARFRSHPADLDANAADLEADQPVARGAVIAIVIAFIALQATNSAAVSIMSLFVTERLDLALIWSGIALGASALLEIPALLIIGRMSRRVSSHALIISGCVTGTMYYVAMAFVADPITLVLLQALNAWFFGIVAGVGLTVFQQMIPRPGLASGLFTNTRRIGAIVSGPIIGFGAATSAGYQGVFAVCAGLTVFALIVVEVARRISRRSATPAPSRPQAPEQALAEGHEESARQTRRMSTSLISADELQPRLEDVTLLDVRWQLGRSDGRELYLAGHLPSASYVDLETELADPPAAPVDDRGRHPLPDAERFAAAMRRCGVRADRMVVVYDDWDGMAAARAWWLLRYHGHTDVALLDGGYQAWREAGFGTETGDHLGPSGDFEADSGHLPVLDAAGAASVAEHGVLLDARAPERFRGEVEPLDPVAGHVPGARSVPATDNVRDGRFRPLAELREVYAVIDGAEEVAAYCGSGVTAAHDLFALHLLGRDGALFAGAWSGWVADPTRPVGTGSEPE